MRLNPQNGLKNPAGKLLLALALGIFLAGALRLWRWGNFTLTQGAFCLVAIPAGALLLLVFDYTLHHARIAALMVIAILMVWVFRSPTFCIGLGLALAGMVLKQDR
jgi:phosphatidylserine synthase